MKLQPALIGFGAVLMLSASAIYAEPDNSTAKPDTCALLKPADLTGLLGGTPDAKAKGPSCRWVISGSKSKLIVVEYPDSGMGADMAFENARQKVKGAVTDEKGLGDRAFAHMQPNGVGLVIIKQGRLMQIQYGTGAEGTTKDLDALLPVAKKAADAY